MSNADRIIAAETRRIDQGAAQAACAYWYACGYNDHRSHFGGDSVTPYVDPNGFAAHWVTLNNQPSRPSLQDAFKTYMKEVTA